MPMRYNGVYQDHSVPKNSSEGVGKGVAVSSARPGMGKPQYMTMKPDKGGMSTGGASNARTSHDLRGNRTYSR